VNGFGHGNVFFELFLIPFPFQPIILTAFLANMVTCLVGNIMHINNLLNRNVIAHLVYERMQTGNM
jgi:hypothetical protein